MAVWQLSLGEPFRLIRAGVRCWCGAMSRPGDVSPSRGPNGESSREALQYCSSRSSVVEAIRTVPKASQAPEGAPGSSWGKRRRMEAADGEEGPEQKRTIAEMPRPRWVVGSPVWRAVAAIHPIGTRRIAKPFPVEGASSLVDMLPAEMDMDGGGARPSHTIALADGAAAGVAAGWRTTGVSVSESTQSSEFLAGQEGEGVAGQCGEASGAA